MKINDYKKKEKQKKEKKENNKQRQTIVKVKLSTLVEGDSKAPFSIATTSKCRGGRYSFPWIDCSTLPLILTL